MTTNNNNSPVFGSWLVSFRVFFFIFLIFCFFRFPASFVLCGVVVVCSFVRWFVRERLALDAASELEQLDLRLCERREALRVF